MSIHRWRTPLAPGHSSTSSCQRLSKSAPFYWTYYICITVHAHLYNPEDLSYLHLYFFALYHPHTCLLTFHSKLYHLPSPNYFLSWELCFGLYPRLRAAVLILFFCDPHRLKSTRNTHFEWSRRQRYQSSTCEGIRLCKVLFDLT